MAVSHIVMEAEESSQESIYLPRLSDRFKEKQDVEWDPFKFRSLGHGVSPHTKVIQSITRHAMAAPYQRDLFAELFVQDPVCQPA